MKRLLVFLLFFVMLGVSPTWADSTNSGATTNTQSNTSGSNTAITGGYSAETTTTYESGSSTGIKLYLNGELQVTKSNLAADGFDITGANDFSLSNPTSEPELLNIGGGDQLGGGGSNNRWFNGFLQYPRIYNRTITAQEVAGSTSARTYSLYCQNESGHSANLYHHHTTTDTAAIGYVKPMIIIKEIKQ